MSNARDGSDDTSHSSSAPGVPEAAARVQARDEQRSWERFVWDDAGSASEPAIEHSEERAPDLPRIVLPQPAAPTASRPDGQEEWRRQFISALREVDDDRPIPAPKPGPASSRADAARRSDESRDANRQDGERRPLAYARRVELRPLVARRRIGRTIAGSAVALGIFSTGALWATYTPAKLANHDVRTASIAAVVPKVDAHSNQAPADQPMVNSPVLVREGEATPPLSMPDTSAWRRPPAAAAVAPAPRPDVSAPVPPLIINRTVTVHPVPAPGATSLARRDQQLSGAAVQPPSVGAPLERASLTELATRPVPLPAPQSQPPTSAAPSLSSRGTQHQASTRQEPAPAAEPRRETRISAEAYQSQAPSTSPSASRQKWERRQGLKTADPEPEPSTLKKLLSNMWPGATPSTSLSAKPAAPAPASAAAPTAPAHDWSSKSSADP